MFVEKMDEELKEVMRVVSELMETPSPITEQSLTKARESRPHDNQSMDWIFSSIGTSPLAVEGNKRKQNESLEKSRDWTSPTNDIQALAVEGSQRPADFSMQQTPLKLDGLMQTPLPALDWAESTKMWKEMRSTDWYKAAPDEELRLRHPCILPENRAMLLEWLMIVCEFFKLHRDTFHLALDTYDRFMDTQRGVQKDQLELIGITCLFIACKMEEVYPKKLMEFEYISDGVCSAAKIREMEFVILTALDWRMSHHITVNSWMSLYMQLESHKFPIPGFEFIAFEDQVFAQQKFVRVMQILDLCCMDIASRQFGNSVLSAAAYYFLTGSESYLTLVTDYELVDIQKCVDWLAPFSASINLLGTQTTPKELQGVDFKDQHNIQVRDANFRMLKEVTSFIKLRESNVLPSFSPFVGEECILFTSLSPFLDV